MSSNVLSLKKKDDSINFLTIVVRQTSTELAHSYINARPILIWKMEFDQMWAMPQMIPLIVGFGRDHLNIGLGEKWIIYSAHITFVAAETAWNESKQTYHWPSGYRNCHNLWLNNLTFWWLKFYFVFSFWAVLFLALSPCHFAVTCSWLSTFIRQITIFF